MWHSLTPPWQACLELAWEAYCDGTVAIGALITNADGDILARGRNRIHGSSNGDGYIRHNPLAHAEINALLTLDYQAHNPHTCILYTTTEPCPMCMGMFYMSGIRTLHYACRDPFAGSVNMLGTTPYLSRKPIKAFGPPDPVLEAAILGMHVEVNLFENSPYTGSLHEAWRSVIPGGVALGEKLHQTGALRQMRELGASTAEVIMNLYQQSMELSVS
ncbi:MAG: nucleoside deaminase [Chloroflexi bacterium]|nr:nucleoside deaminase [Chloroflexota bacterium]